MEQAQEKLKLKTAERDKLRIDEDHIRNVNLDLKSHKQNTIEEITQLELMLRKQQKIQEEFTTKVQRKKIDYKVYMKALKNEKEKKIKTRDLLKDSLDKIYQMQKELSVFLKMTNSKVSSGMKFLEEVKDLDEEVTYKELKIGAAMDYDPDDFDLMMGEEDEKKESKEVLSLKTVREILSKVNNKIVRKRTQLI